MCLTGFWKAETLADHEKHCNGLNVAPKRIEMPKEGQNKLKFEDLHKQMKAPLVIYADFEALVQQIYERERERTSCTEKMNKHEACGLAYTVVRCDGKIEPVDKYRQSVDGQKNPAETFLEMILEHEQELREILKTPVPIKMIDDDWVRFRSAQNCHIGDENLVVPEFQDSIGVWDKDTRKYCGESHKNATGTPSSSANSLLLAKKTKDKQKTQPTNGSRRPNQIACFAQHRCFRKTSGTQ